MAETSSSSSIFHDFARTCMNTPNQTATQTQTKSLLLVARSESHTWSERVPHSVNTALQLAIECMYTCTIGSQRRLHFYKVTVCEETPHNAKSS